MYIVAWHGELRSCYFSDEGGRDAGQTASDAELGVQFTEIFIKKSDNVTLLLGLLEVIRITWI